MWVRVAGVAEEGRSKWMSEEFVPTKGGGGSEDSFRDRIDGDGRKSSVRLSSPANLKPHLGASTTPPGSVHSYKNLSYSAKTIAGQKPLIDDVSVDIRGGELAIMVSFISTGFFLIIIPGTIRSVSLPNLIGQG